jgi:hypothetical protein
MERGPSQVTSGQRLGVHPCLTLRRRARRRRTFSRFPAIALKPMWRAGCVDEVMPAVKRPAQERNENDAPRSNS